MASGSMRTTTFVFHAKRPVEHLDIVEEQMFRAHKYYNFLVETQQELYNLYSEQFQHDPEVSVAVQALNNARNELRDIKMSVGRERSAIKLKWSKLPESEKSYPTPDISDETKDALHAARKKVREHENAAEEAKKEFLDNYYSSSPIMRDAYLEFKRCRELESSAKKDKTTLVADRKHIEQRRKDASKAFIECQRKADDVSRKYTDNADLLRKVGVSGLHSGTFNEVWKAFSQSVETSWSLPKYKRFSKNSKLTLQGPALKNNRLAGYTVDEFFTKNNLFWMEPVSEDAYIRPGDERKKGEGRMTRCRTFFHMLVGRNDQRQGMAKIPVLLHRQLPQNGRIKYASLVRKEHVNRIEWEVHLTVEVPVELKSIVRVAGIDVGWRRLDNGSIRVACASSADGELVAELALSSKILNLADTVERISSARDTAFNTAKALIVDWIKNTSVELHPYDEPNRKFIANWRSKRKLKTFLRRNKQILPDHIRQHMFGDNHIFHLKNERFRRVPKPWYHMESELLQRQEFSRKKMFNLRKHLYRDFALNLTRNFDAVSLEKLNLQCFSKKPDLASGPGTIGRSTRYQKNIVAISEFKEILASAFSRLGGELVFVDAKYSSQECSCCGHSDSANRHDLEFVCMSCGYAEDADFNAAKNIARRGLQRFSSGESAVKEVTKRRSTVRRRPKRSERSGAEGVAIERSHDART